MYFLREDDESSAITRVPYLTAELHVQDACSSLTIGAFKHLLYNLRICTAQIHQIMTVFQMLF